MQRGKALQAMPAVVLETPADCKGCQELNVTDAQLKRLYKFIKTK